MPHSSDEPPSDRISAGPPDVRPTEGAETAGTRPGPPSNSGEDVTISNNPQSGTADNGEAPRLPRRRRRRRRRPPREADAAGATAEGQSQATEPTIAGDAPHDGDLPRYGEPRRRRRRRRGPQRVPGPTEATGGETPAVQSAPEARPSFVEPAGPAAQGNAPQNASPQDSEPRGGTLREHRGPPHRRRRPPRSASSIGEAGTGLAGGESAPAVGSEPRGGQPREPTHSPRRRRWLPRSTDATAAGADQAVGSAPTEAPRDRSAPDRGPRARGPGNHRTREEGRAATGAEGRNRDSRDRRPRSKGAPSPTDRRKGTGRDVSKKGPEQRLYALEAVVDRGFEDVPEEAEDSATRRVPWTIIKRTVADQQSGKPISAIYVLQRDGIDTEFPSLGTARAAANKTIVHPEKLTLSKAEHAAAKK